MLIEVISRTSNYERQVMADEYKKKYNKTVFDELNNFFLNENNYG